MPRTIVCGDIHGNYKGLIQCIERSGFDKKSDTLIQLGDICDGWSQVYECVEELLTIDNLIAIKGNHDDWFLDFIELAGHPVQWGMGGYGTAKSYLRQIGKENSIQQIEKDKYIASLIPEDIPETHRHFFKTQRKYYIDEHRRLFIHAGFNRHYLLSEQSWDEIFWWDRDFWMSSLSHTEVQAPFKIKEKLYEIYIGHTATTAWGGTKPMNSAGKVYNVDTGSGFKGKLTFMDINTKDIWQSDFANELYADELGRN